MLSHSCDEEVNGHWTTLLVVANSQLWLEERLPKNELYEMLAFQFLFFY